MLHGVQKLTAALKNTPASTVYAQLKAVKALQDIIEHWSEDTKAPISTTDLLRCNLSTHKHRAPRVPTATPGTSPAPRVKAPQRVKPFSTEDILANHQTISQRLRSQSDPKKLEPATVIEQPVAHCNITNHPARYESSDSTGRAK